MKAIDTQVDGEHYLAMGIEPWHVVGPLARKRAVAIVGTVDATLTFDDAVRVIAQALEDFYYEGNQVKYVMREGKKDVSNNDEAKAIHYGQRRLDLMSEAQLYIVSPTLKQLQRDPVTLTQAVRNDVEGIVAKLKGQ